MELEYSEGIIRDPVSVFQAIEEKPFQQEETFCDEGLPNAKTPKQGYVVSLLRSIIRTLRALIFRDSENSEKVISFTSILYGMAVFFTIIVALASTLTTYFVELSSYKSCKTMRNSEQELVSRYLIDEVADYFEGSNYSIAALFGLSSGFINVDDVNENKSKEMFYFVSAKMSNRYNTTDLNFFSAPKGTVGEVYPLENEWLVGVDIFTQLDLSDAIPSFYDPCGPMLLSLFTRRFSTDTEWHLVKIAPLYTGVVVGVSPLWGVIGSFISLESLPFVTLRHQAEAYDTDYLMVLQHENGEYFLIGTSVHGIDENATAEVIREFMSGGSTAVIRGSNLSLLMITRSKTKCLWVRRLEILLIVDLVLSFLVFLTLFFLIRLTVRAYDAFQCAPKNPPFALLKIGPQYGQELWNLAPEEMRQAAHKWSQLLDGSMKRFHAYPLSRLQLYTTTFVFNTVSDAVLMAGHVLEEISGAKGSSSITQRRRIDEELVNLLGEDGKFVVTCVIHWCTDATVTEVSSNEVMQYKGNDVLLGSKLWFAAPSQSLILSNAAKDELVHGEGAECQLTYACGVLITGYSGTQDLFLLSSLRIRRKTKWWRRYVQWEAKGGKEVVRAASAHHGVVTAYSKKNDFNSSGTRGVGGEEEEEEEAEEKEVGRGDGKKENSPKELFEEINFPFSNRDPSSFSFERGDIELLTEQKKAPCCGKIALHGKEAQPIYGKHNSSFFTEPKRIFKRQSVVDKKKVIKKKKGKKSPTKKLKGGSGSGGGSRNPLLLSDASSPKALVAAFSSTDFLLRSNETASWHEYESSATCSMPSLSLNLSTSPVSTLSPVAQSNSTSNHMHDAVVPSGSVKGGNKLFTKYFPFFGVRSRGSGSVPAPGFTLSGLPSASSFLLFSTPSFPFTTEDKKEKGHHPQQHHDEGSSKMSRSSIIRSSQEHSTSLSDTTYSQRRKQHLDSIQRFPLIHSSPVSQMGSHKVRKAVMGDSKSFELETAEGGRGKGRRRFSRDGAVGGEEVMLEKISTSNNPRNTSKRGELGEIVGSDPEEEMKEALGVTGCSGSGRLCSKRKKEIFLHPHLDGNPNVLKGSGNMHGRVGKKCTTSRNMSSASRRSVGSSGGIGSDDSSSRSTSSTHSGNTHRFSLPHLLNVLDLSFSRGRSPLEKIPNPLGNVCGNPPLGGESSTPFTPSLKEHLFIHHEPRVGGRKSLDHQFTSISQVLRQIPQSSSRESLPFQQEKKAVAGKEEEEEGGGPHLLGGRDNTAVKERELHASKEKGSATTEEASPDYFSLAPVRKHPPNNHTLQGNTASSPFSIPPPLPPRLSSRSFDEVAVLAEDDTAGGVIVPLSQAARIKKRKLTSPVGLSCSSSEKDVGDRRKGIPSTPPPLGEGPTEGDQDDEKEEWEEGTMFAGSELGDFSGAFSWSPPWMPREKKNKKGMTRRQPSNRKCGEKESKPSLSFSPIGNESFDPFLHSRSSTSDVSGCGRIIATNKEEKEEMGDVVLLIDGFPLHCTSPAFLPALSSSQSDPLADRRSLVFPMEDMSSFMNRKLSWSCICGKGGSGNSPSGSRRSSTSSSTAGGEGPLSHHHHHCPHHHRRSGSSSAPLSGYPVLSMSSSISSRMLLLASSLHSTHCTPSSEGRHFSRHPLSSLWKRCRRESSIHWYHHHHPGEGSPTGGGDPPAPTRITLLTSSPTHSVSSGESTNGILFHPRGNSVQRHASLIHEGGGAKRESHEWGFGEDLEKNGLSTQGICLPPAAVLSPTYVASTVSPYARQSLHQTFRTHPLSSTIDFAHALPLMAMFYTARELLFQPLSPAEQEKITGCLATAFGVPVDGLVYYLAVHGAFWYVHQDKDLVEALWGEDDHSQS